MVAVIWFTAGIAVLLLIFSVAAAKKIEKRIKKKVNMNLTNISKNSHTSIGGDELCYNYDINKQCKI